MTGPSPESPVVVVRSAEATWQLVVDRTLAQGPVVSTRPGPVVFSLSGCLMDSTGLHIGGESSQSSVRPVSGLVVWAHARVDAAPMRLVLPGARPL